MNKESNNSIKFIGIIIILLLIVIIAILTLPRIEEAREKSFRVEATKIVSGAQKYISDLDSGKNKLSSNSNSCIKGKEVCVTISELNKLNYYESSNDNYVGKVVIDITDSNNYLYYLYLKKSADLRIIGGFREDYTTMGSLSIEPWEEEYETCNCE